MLKNINKLIIILIIVLFCLVSCYMIIKPPKVPPPPVEFDQTSCKNPCWHGLQVGVSTRQDVQNILNTFPVEPNKIGIDSGEYTSGDQFVKIEFYEEPYRYYMNGACSNNSF